MTLQVSCPETVDTPDCLARGTGERRRRSLRNKRMESTLSEGNEIMRQLRGPEMLESSVKIGYVVKWSGDGQD